MFISLCTYKSQKHICCEFLKLNFLAYKGGKAGTEGPGHFYNEEIISNLFHLQIKLVSSYSGICFTGHISKLKSGVVAVASGRAHMLVLTTNESE